MTDEETLAGIRLAYAREMLAGVPAPDEPLEAAFAHVPREHFLGGEKWTLVSVVGGIRTLPENDPALVYQDVLIQLDAARHVNNGSPSLHALMIHHLGVRTGDRVLHVGAGTGYYTAILAEIAGRGAHIEAVEFDEKLASAAAANLAEWPQVAVRHGDGAAFPAHDVDRIYVNFGVARPAPAWLAHLHEGGTLEFPLCAPKPQQRFGGSGAVLLVTRRGTGFAVKLVSSCAFVMAEGALGGDADTHARLNAAFDRGGVEFVQSLRLDQPSPERCWFWSPQWCLSYDEPPAPL